MKLNVTKVVDPGSPRDERIVLKASQETDLGAYVLFRARLAGHGVSNKLEETFWFPDRKLNKDDLVVVYTSKGAETKSQSKDGTTSYFFHWNLDSPIWKEEDAVPLLMRVEAWDYLDIHPKDIIIKSPSRTE